MATLYTEASSNIRKTWFFITGFLVLIIALGWLFSYVFDNQGILVFATILSIAMSFGSYWYSDKIVLSLVRAQLIQKSDNPELYRVVENLCITAGLPLPKIYIMQEAQPNAFATGRDKNHAVVVVTTGILAKLNKTELEGVIAHELSHIGNKDILLGAVITVLVGIVANASNFFLRFGFFGGGGGGRKRDSGEGEMGLILMVLAIIAAILAPIGAMLIQLAISRKREFLADESGALLTRYPEGLASALEKISDDQTPMRVASNSTSHLFIASPLKGKQVLGWLAKLFSTHPPIEERIKALRDLRI